MKAHIYTEMKAVTDFALFVILLAVIWTTEAILCSIYNQMSSFIFDFWLELCNSTCIFNINETQFHPECQMTFFFQLFQSWTNPFNKQQYKLTFPLLD